MKINIFVNINKSIEEKKKCVDKERSFMSVLVEACYLFFFLQKHDKTKFRKKFKLLLFC